MIGKATIQFLKDLKKNNKKEWFDKHRGRFDDARADFEKFTHEIITRLGKTDETITYLQPREATFRQNRDVRFSKDKSPYKVNMGMYLSKGGRKGIQAGYYFHLEPGGSMAGGGLWVPMAPELKKARQEIDYNWDEFRSIVQSKKFKSVFGDLDMNSEIKLSRPPKGYEADNPAVEYLKLKSIITSRKIPDSDLTSANLPKLVTSYFETLKPLIDFLNRAIEE